MRPLATLLALGKQGISRFPRKMFPCMRKVSDRAGSRGILRFQYPRCCLPRRPTTSAPWFLTNFTAQYSACMYPC
jgi:hypothetical protein